MIQRFLGPLQAVLAESDALKQSQETLYALDLGLTRETPPYQIQDARFFFVEFYPFGQILLPVRFQTRGAASLSARSTAPGS